jgi:hypothetical protein
MTGKRDKATRACSIVQVDIPGLYHEAKDGECFIVTAIDDFSKIKHAHADSSEIGCYATNSNLDHQVGGGNANERTGDSF